MPYPDLSSLIGGRVRARRQQRGWTLDHLAEATGLSRRAVVNVEQGASNPSIGTLLRLSEALGIALPALVEPPRSPGVRVTRAGDGAVLWTGPHGGRGVLVAATSSPDAHELWDWTLGPHDEHRSEPHPDGTGELLQVLDGTLEVDVDGATTTLAAGDGLSFRGDLPHAYRNPDATPVRFVLTVREPAPGRPA